MFPMVWRAVAVVVAVVICLEVQATHRLVVSGTVFEDRVALALRSNFVPLPGVAIKLYRDGGDKVPSADDAPAGTTRTNESGVYLLHVEEPGNYWLTVDSRSIAQGKGWAEQTFGPSRSICAQPDGTTRILGFEGSCFGGRSASRSDDATALVSAEHVALIAVTESVTGADFAFSFDAVINTADDDRIQGSFRQFLVNAALFPGPNRMRFVPVEKAPEQRQTTFGVPPRWWKITANAPLPEVTDADTIIDGTAYNFIAAGSEAYMHPGRVGEAATLKPNERRLPRLEKPDLEIIVRGEEGIVCSARCGVRGLALHGAPVAMVASADTSLEGLILGASPDAIPAEIPGMTGLRIDRGTTVARGLMVTGQTSIGISVGKEARLDAERLDVSRCGAAQSGAAIVLFSSGSSVRNSSIAGNPGAGILLGAIDGSSPANGNTIDSTVISANQAGILFSPGASGNTITRNDIIWNRFGGVTVVPHSPDAAPKGNRISANRFDENGLRPIVLDLNVENPNRLLTSKAKCDRSPLLANAGISAPRVTEVKVLSDQSPPRVVVRGSACPGEVVEIYQSFVTSGIRSESADMADVRNTRGQERETLTSQERTRALPSIGEFNYLGAANTAANGTFEGTFVLAESVPMERDPNAEEATDIWAHDVLTAAKATDRAFSAIAIDPEGNTSEMSVRRGVH